MWQHDADSQCFLLPDAGLLTRHMLSCSMHESDTTHKQPRAAYAWTTTSCAPVDNSAAAAMQALHGQSDQAVPVAPPLPQVELSTRLQLLASGEQRGSIVISQQECVLVHHGRKLEYADLASQPAVQKEST